MRYTTVSLAAPDAAGETLLRRALAVYSEDVAGDLHVLLGGLARGEKRGLLLLEGGTPCGAAIWSYEDEAGQYAAVELLHIEPGEAAAELAELLVKDLWAALLEDPKLDMIAVRVRQPEALLPPLRRREAVVFTRRMMTRELFTWEPPAVRLPEGYTLARWEDAHQPQIEVLAALIQQDNVDAVIMPDAQPERMGEALRQIRAGTYPDAGPIIPEATLALLHGVGTVCGYVATVDMGMLGFVMDVAVHPDHRGRGLGRQLMLAVCNALKSEGVGLLGLAVTAQNPAVRLYESLGFRVAQEGETAVWWRDGRQLRWQ
ncbi:MAG: GNAT family N-acetyltransferase [Anaerolineae bacterium]|nr:GNAT family N-acetyltransferase [Anaerolineae bacterium]